MTLAPTPCTTINGHPVYADPAKSGQPRHPWLAIEWRNHNGRIYGVQLAAAATKEAAAHKARGGSMEVIETAAHQWAGTKKNLPWH